MSVGVYQVRQIGGRKYNLMTAIHTELNNMTKKGINPRAVCKFLKIQINGLQTAYRTKELSGVLGRLKEFNKVN